MSDDGRRFRLSKENRIIAGVAGGVAEYFKTDPALIRLIFVVLLFAHGLGFLIYIVLLVIGSHEAENVASDLKKESATASSSSNESFDQGRHLQRLVGNDMLAVILILLGIYLLVGQFVDLAWLTAKILWPALLIVIGGYLLLKKDRRNNGKK